MFYLLVFHIIYVQNKTDKSCVLALIFETVAEKKDNNVLKHFLGKHSEIYKTETLYFVFIINVIQNGMH